MQLINQNEVELLKKNRNIHDEEEKQTQSNANINNYNDPIENNSDILPIFKRLVKA